MAFEVDNAIGLAELVGLIDDTNGLANFHELIEKLDVLGIQPDAAMTDPHADPVRLVGAVDQVPGHLQLQDSRAERILGPGRHDSR